MPTPKRRQKLDTELGVVCVCFTRPEYNQKIYYIQHTFTDYKHLNRVVIVFDQTVDLFLVFYLLKKNVYKTSHTHIENRKGAQNKYCIIAFFGFFIKKRIFRPRFIALVCVCVCVYADTTLNDNEL
jgi:hypothetical protein